MSRCKLNISSSIRKRSILLVLILNTYIIYADRIYIVNTPGYNTAEPQLINAIIDNGHTVVTLNTSSINSLPPNFTSRCIDPINGYDWLCFFGDTDFSNLLPQIKNFIDAGGKVFYQYEVSCCTISSSSIATILSGLTGLTITQNANSYIAAGNVANWPAWASNIGCCSMSIKGNAYKGLDGIPINNQLLASTNLNSSTPPVSTCQNFGCFFKTTDFIGTSHKGAFIGIGDLNLWYDGGEPISNAGTIPINLSVINYFFPNDTSICHIINSGCIEQYNNSNINIGKDTVLCDGDELELNAYSINSSYSWQDNSTSSTFLVTHEGNYWVTVTNSCGPVSDTINIKYNPIPTINLGQDHTMCNGETITLQAFIPNSTYLWQDGSSTPTFSVTIEGNYWVTVSNNCGVTADTINIIVKECDVILEMPNIFTANNDGINDVFYPVKMVGITQFELSIYNRWGQRLFETEDLKTGWKGDFNGTLCPSGTYYWIINYTDIYDNHLSKKGFLTLLQ